MAFLLCCLRVQAATLCSEAPHLAVSATLLVGGILLGTWNPGAALFAFTLSVPLLNGLGQTGVLPLANPLSLVFSAVWTGIFANRITSTVIAADSPARLGTMQIGAGRRDERPNEGLVNRVVRNGSADKLFCAAADIMAGAVILSLAWQLWGNRSESGIWEAIIQRPDFGFGERYYFVSSAFLWLQGLFYFRALCEVGSPSKLCPSSSRHVASWLNTVVFAYALTMGVFLLLQVVLHVPEGWTSAGVQSPFEDISSFGSIAVALLIFTVATLHQGPRLRIALDLSACVTLLVMLIASWSRGAWLAATILLFLTVTIRLSRVWSIAALILVVASVSFVNATSNRGFWITQPYSTRVATLARFENPLGKDPVRLNLYRKAAEMIQERPIFGHGIGSFYLKSVNYAGHKDPYAGVPEFAHNVFLQVAVELGLPISILLACLLGRIFWLGGSTWYFRERSVTGSSTIGLSLLGATLGLGAYVETQMTANSLNVYASNQFFFWFLIAAILSMSSHSSIRNVSGSG
jgi:O-antigen ligase